MDASVKEKKVETTEKERLCMCVSVCLCVWKTVCAVLREVSQTSPLTWPGPLEPERKPCKPQTLFLCVSHIHTLALSVLLCEYVISKHVLLARRAREVACERERGF